MTLKPLKTINFGGEDTYYLKPEWENIENPPFGETTVMGDTLTWDGDTSKVETIDPTGSGQLLLCLISDTVPTSSDFANGVKIVFGSGVEQGLTADKILPLGNGVLAESNFNFVIVSNDNTTVTVPYMGMTLTVTFPKKGVYFGMAVGSGYTQSITINGYTGFEMVKITPIETKYLGGDYDIVFTAEDLNTDEPTATCNKIFAELKAMPLERLRTAVVKCNIEVDGIGNGISLENVMPVVAVSKVTATDGTSSNLLFAFNYTDSLIWRRYVIGVQGDNIAVQTI